MIIILSPVLLYSQSDSQFVDVHFKEISSKGCVKLDPDLFISGDHTFKSICYCFALSMFKGTWQTLSDTSIRLTFIWKSNHDYLIPIYTSDETIEDSLYHYKFEIHGSSEPSHLITFDTTLKLNEGTLTSLKPIDLNGYIRLKIDSDTFIIYRNCILNLDSSENFITISLSEPMETVQEEYDMVVDDQKNFFIYDKYRQTAIAHYVSYEKYLILFREKYSSRAIKYKTKE